jgi:hypothetical protein
MFSKDPAMRSTWFRRIKRFIELFTPGGTEYTRRGTEIHYTSDGLSSIPPHAREKLLFMVLAEFKKPGAGNARGDRS